MEVEGDDSALILGGGTTRPRVLAMMAAMNKTPAAPKNPAVNPDCNASGSASKTVLLLDEIMTTAAKTAPHIACPDAKAKVRDQARNPPATPSLFLGSEPMIELALGDIKRP